ncbi:MAG: glycoside hydrolase family 3 C-terminal domain-containing protein [Anaerosomatales bacterium]
MDIATAGTDGALDPRARAREIVSRLSTWEKVRVLSGRDMWHLEPVPGSDAPAIRMADGPHGLRREIDRDGGGSGIGPSAPATCFPAAAALACSWDPGLAETFGRALGTEARSQGVSVVLAPGLNLKRHPCCGRNFEYFSEDPLLSGTMAAAVVRGIQSTGVGACVKHFAANNQETDRMVLDTIVDERTLRELYLAGFEIAVRKSAPRAVMCAYNKINGVYCSDDPRLLTTILRDEWGFDGVVMSDWGATNDRVAGVAAGLDLEMPSSAGASDALLREVITDGVLPESALDAAAERVIALALSTLPAEGSDDVSLDPEQHHALARRIAAECTVLLTNDGVLPLKPTGRIGMIGAFAESPRYQGAGSSRVTPTSLDTALGAMRGRVEESASLTYARGYDAETGESDDSLIDSALRTAGTADVVVLFVGLPPAYESEGADREHMRLPAGQERLIEAVCAANPRTVVVLSGGAPVEMEWAELPAAIVDGYLGGQAGGSAVVDVLFGDHEPGGRLAETFPVRQADVLADANFPGVDRQVEYREGLYVGYRHFCTAGTPVRFPFGHGLSYTSFDYGEPRLSVERVEAGEEATVTVPVTNTGERPGSTVIQAYVGPPPTGRVDRPALGLAGFAKVRLEPGESTEVVITLPFRAFEHYDVASASWQTEGGEYEVLVGESVATIIGSAALSVDSDFAPPPGVRPRARVARGSEFSRMLGRPIPTPVPPVPYTRTSMASDLNASRIGRRVQRRLLAEARQRAAQTDDPTMKTLIETAVLQMPLRNLVTMSDGALSWKRLDALIDALNGRYFSALRRLLSR